MGNIILLDLISLNYIHPYLFEIYASVPDNLPIYNLDFFTLFNQLDTNTHLNLLNLLDLDKIVYISLSKFFFDLAVAVPPVSFLLIYLYLLVISIISNIKLYIKFIIFIKNFIHILEHMDLEISLFILVPFIETLFIYFYIIDVKKHEID